MSLHLVCFVFCLFLPVHKGLSALAGMLMGTVNSWGRTATECKFVIIRLTVSSLEERTIHHSGLWIVLAITINK